MTGIPHDFFVRECTHSFSATLPAEGHYAVGNIFFSLTETASQQATFESIAHDLGLRVLGWRDVPTDNSILGPASKSKEPRIKQPFIVLESHYGGGEESQHGTFDEKYFLRQLYVLRKQATHKMYVSLPYLSFPLIIIAVAFPNPSISVPSLHPTSSTKVNSPLSKSTTTTMI